MLRFFLSPYNRWSLVGVAGVVVLWVAIPLIWNDLYRENLHVINWFLLHPAHPTPCHRHRPRLCAGGLCPDAERAGLGILPDGNALDGKGPGRIGHGVRMIRQGSDMPASDLPYLQRGILTRVNEVDGSPRAEPSQIQAKNQYFQ